MDKYSVTLDGGRSSHFLIEAANKKEAIIRIMMLPDVGDFDTITVKRRMVEMKELPTKQNASSGEQEGVPMPDWVEDLRGMAEEDEEEVG